jgi:hypothetical protein
MSKLGIFVTGRDAVTRHSAEHFNPEATVVVGVQTVAEIAEAVRTERLSHIVIVRPGIVFSRGISTNIPLNGDRHCGIIGDGLKLALVSPKYIAHLEDGQIWESIAGQDEVLVRTGWQGNFLAAFPTTFPDNYDFNRYRVNCVAVSIEGRQRDEFNRVKEEVWHFLKNNKPIQVENVSYPMIHELSSMRRDGVRCELKKRGGSKLNHMVTIATKEVAEDLTRLIPTALFYTDAHLHIICDPETAAMLPRTLDKRIHVYPMLTEKALNDAIGKLKNLTVQSDYWKPGPIWWKLKGLEWLAETLNDSLMLVDSDIVFTGRFDERLRGDAKLSPFFWPDPLLSVRRAPDSDDFVPISERDGWINAGYAWIRSEEVATYWKELYESGIGGFYEQWCMGFLPSKFKCSYFDERHNHGNWRNQAPDDETISVHIHAETRPKKKSLISVQNAANSAVDRAISEVPAIILKR